MCNEEKKTFGLEKDWHSTSSLYEKYKPLTNTKSVSYRRFSELLKDLENTGLLESHTGSKGQKGYSTEFKLVVQPEIVGPALFEEWWNENVVKKKKDWDLPSKSGKVPKTIPMYGLYMKMMDDQKKYW